MLSNLFKLYSDSILREMGTLPGFILGARNIRNILHADDTKLIAVTERKTKNMAHIIRSFNFVISSPRTHERQINYTNYFVMLV